MGASKKLLVIGHAWPEPNATAAGGRMLQLLEFFLAHDFDINFVSTANAGEYAHALEGMGIKPDTVALNDSSFNTFVSLLKPDVVLFDRFVTEEQFGWRVSEAAPNALLILDTEDLHSLRKSREMAQKGEEPWSKGFWLQQDITKRELTSILRCDLSLVISKFEMELLTEHLGLPANILLYIPFMFSPLSSKQLGEWLPFNSRQHFCCIGNGLHGPNVDALRWLKQKIWPTIRQRLPNAEVHIYGAYLQANVQQLHHPPSGFIVKGFVPDAQMTIGQYRVLLAPLRYGGGIKGKLALGWATGTPSVTTAIGVEGMGAPETWSGLVGDQADDLAQAAVKLYSDPEIWQTAQENGKVLYDGLFDKDYHHVRFRRVLGQLLKDVSEHREQHFLSGLLKHHSLQSSRYLSKWIEAKNRLPKG